MPRKSPNSTPVPSTTIAPPSKPASSKAPTLSAQVASLTESVAALAALVQGQVAAPSPEADKPARKGRKPAAAKASVWAKDVRFTYVKKNGAESTFRITEVSGKRAKARNEGTGFASAFKLTTLDALLQAGNVKDVR